MKNEQLIAKRKSRNLSQEQAAKAVGISTRNYKYIEAGERKPNVETAISIAELLESSVPDLFGPRRQPGDDDTQSDYSNSKPDGIDRVKELESAKKDFDLDVAAILDIAEDGQLDDPYRKKIASRLLAALRKVLDGAA
jgi:DNA-binding XRE family transcriptional regulator